jgi:hypothetical protein
MARKPDSVVHNEERREQMREEAAAQQAQAGEAEEKRELDQAERKRVAREAENQELAQHVGLVQAGETREMLLERIRKLRNEKPEVKEDEPGFRPPSLQKEFDAEQEAGRAAVARAQEELERNREVWRKQEEEEKARRHEGITETVHHPNPTQNEVFPTSKPR